MRRLSLVMMLSDKAREDRLVVLDQLALDRPKTKEMVKVLEDIVLKRFNLENHILLH